MKDFIQQLLTLHKSDPGSSVVLLSPGIVCLIDTDDLEKVMGVRWYAQAMDNGTHYVYATRPTASRGNVKRWSIHRLITDAPGGLVVDHLNGNPLDNRKCNLRVVEQRINTQNQQNRSRSGFQGVGWCAQTDRWVAQIMYQRQSIKLRRCESATDAARIYDAAARILFGDRCRLNFPDDPAVQLDRALLERLSAKKGRALVGGRS